MNQQHYLWEVPVMTQAYGNTGGVALVAIDIAKKQNAVLIRLLDGTRKRLTVTNDLQGFRELAHYLKKLKDRVRGHRKLPSDAGLLSPATGLRTGAYLLRGGIPDARGHVQLLG
jgi:hypothetical protein